jgi:ribosomal protein L13E
MNSSDSSSMLLSPSLGKFDFMSRILSIVSKSIHYKLIFLISEFLKSSTVVKTTMGKSFESISSTLFPAVKDLFDEDIFTLFRTLASLSKLIFQVPSIQGDERTRNRQLQLLQIEKDRLNNYVKVLFDVEISTILKDVAKLNQYRKHLYSPNAFFLETNPESVDNVMEKLFSDAMETIRIFSLIPYDTIEDFVLSQSLPSSTSIDDLEDGETVTFQPKHQAEKIVQEQEKLMKILRFDGEMALEMLRGSYEQLNLKSSQQSASALILQRSNIPVPPSPQSERHALTGDLSRFSIGAISDISKSAASTEESLSFSATRSTRTNISDLTSAPHSTSSGDCGVKSSSNGVIYHGPTSTSTSAATAINQLAGRSVNANAKPISLAMSVTSETSSSSSDSQAKSMINEFRDMGFTADQLQRQGKFSLKQLWQAQYPLAQLKLECSATVTQLRNLGITADKLLENDLFQMIEIKEAGYTAADLRSVGIPLERLHEVGYTAIQAIQAGYSLEECNEVGYTASQLKAAKFTATQLYEIGFEINQLREGGFTAIEMKASGFSASDLHAAGYAAAQMSQASFPVTDLVQAGYTCPQLRAAKYPAKVLYEAGFALDELRQAGFTALQVIDCFEGITARDLKSIGYNPNQLVEAGFSISDLRQAGFTASQVKPICLKRSNIWEMKHVGYTAIELKEAGVTINQLVTLGFSSIDLRNAGYTASQLKAAGFTAHELILAGLTLVQLRDAGFNTSGL